MSAVGTFLRGPWSIAVYTWREGIRKKLLIAFILLSMLVIFGANVLTSFLTELPGTNFGSGVDVRLIKDICITTISLFGVLITIFISASVVPNEVENRVVYTVLSKPVRRYQYLLGKFMGIQLVVLANLLLMGALFFVAIWVKEFVPPTLLLWAILLTYFEFLVVSALTFAVSCASSSAVLPTIAGFFIYIVGNLTEYLKDVSKTATARAATEDLSMPEQIVGWIAWGLSNILPNLQNFSMRQQIIHLQPNDPPQDVQILSLTLYALLFAVSGFIIAYWVFRRKEL